MGKRSEADVEVERIYQALNYKPKPFSRRKFVVPTNEITKPEIFQYQQINSG